MCGLSDLAEMMQIKHEKFALENWQAHFRFHLAFKLNQLF